MVAVAALGALGASVVGASSPRRQGGCGAAFPCDGSTASRRSLRKCGVEPELERRFSRVVSAGGGRFGRLRLNVRAEDGESWAAEEEETAKASNAALKKTEVDSSQSFLKLSQARSWSLGLDAAPRNVASAAEERASGRDDRRRQGLTEYEDLKRELSQMTGGVAVFCSAYCLLTLSVEATVSYAVGALGSLLYLQLLYRHADQVSKDNVADIFVQRRARKIGIRSSDIQKMVEKTVRGSAIALSSPRLVLPAALYGLWIASSKVTGDYTLHLEIAPMMFGFFAFKGAALIQAYRDNQDLLFDFEKHGDSQ